MNDMDIAKIMFGLIGIWFVILTIKMMPIEIKNTDADWQCNHRDIYRYDLCEKREDN